MNIKRIFDDVKFAEKELRVPNEIMTSDMNSTNTYLLN